MSETSLERAAKLFPPGNGCKNNDGDELWYGGIGVCLGLAKICWRLGDDEIADDTATDLIVAELWRRLRKQVVNLHMHYMRMPLVGVLGELYTLRYDKDNPPFVEGPDELALLLDAIEEIET